MGNIDQTSSTSYKSLNEIRTRKETLHEDIRKADEQIRTLWNNLFHQPEISDTRPSKRIMGLLNAGTGIIDGLILGWKLYRKFNGSSLFRGR